MFSKNRINGCFPFIRNVIQRKSFFDFFRFIPRMICRDRLITKIRELTAHLTPWFGQSKRTRTTNNDCYTRNI